MSDNMPSGSRMALSRRTQLLIIGVAVLMVVGALLLGALVKRFVAQPTGAEEKSAIVTGAFRPTKAQWANLKVEAVQSMTFQTEEITDGNIASNEDTTTPVFSPYSGRVTKLMANLGDVVKKGAPLMAVEAPEVVQAQNDLIVAGAALSTASSQQALAQANENRQHELYLAKAAPFKDWAQSQSDFISAQNNFRTAEISLISARNRLRIFGQTEVEIRALETGHNVQKNSPEIILRSPITGTVTQRQVGLGQYINSTAMGASNPVYTISDLSSVWLIANVRETDAPLIKVGQPLQVHVLAYPNRVFKAKVAWVSAVVDTNTRRLPVRAQIDNRDGALKPMMFAHFSIVTSAEHQEPVAAIPESAIVYEGDQSHAWVVGDDGTVALKSIQLGRMNHGMAEVLGGLLPGHKIVTSGTLFIDRAAQGE